jgi:hypothetical protein
MTPFGITAPGRILFGRGEAAKAAALIAGLGKRVLIIHGANGRYAPWLASDLSSLGCEIQGFPCPGEPTLAMLEDALDRARAIEPQVVVGLGGGAVLDLAKALAALVPQSTAPLPHLEGGTAPALPLAVAPLPFVAIPTTAGTGAEATKNAVIGVPEHRRKVSLRDDRMLARLAIVDPALTDGCPRNVTLASGLDAITQVIEPYVSARANPFCDAISLPAIGTGMAALMRLMQTEDQGARDRMAWVSLSGGLALANAGLGAVHGLAGVIGGQTGAAHGAICGALLGPVLAMNRRLAEPGGRTATRLDEVCGILAGVLGGKPAGAPLALQAWARAAGLPGLIAMGLGAGDYRQVAEQALGASSMKGNPVVPGLADLIQAMEMAG